ncbi:Methylamine utilization protein mauG precursor [hydrothermal vent metagenome]|uniref:Methylamine utilization protein mauG n=1 Tax=hydrothermal vent metagenome TaxID=652676 RepID=A0A3B0U428_9ZZZZ
MSIIGRFSNLTLAVFSALPFLFAAAAISPAMAQKIPDFPPAKFMLTTPEKVALGRLLFYDPILGGNRNISCSSCHQPRFGTSDGVSLSLGEGGIGLGPDRRGDPENMPEQRIGRNAPALFNLGAAQFISLFDDGRVQLDPTRPLGIRSPLEQAMVEGFNSVLAVQAMFPVLSQDEMAGQYSENDISQAARRGFLAQKGGVWDIIAARIEAIPQYRKMFDRVIGKEKPITFTAIANMIAQFIAFEWRATDSPFDRYLRDKTPLPGPASAGMELFYGKANCSACHSGRFQSDQKFHAIAIPQIGPGKAARFETNQRDTGRMRVTGNPDDAFRFRTPSLRNITLTGPYGHDGAYTTLRAAVMHHLDPVASLYAYDRTQAILPPLPGANDWAILDDPKEMAAIAAANELAPISLSEKEVDELLAFLASLTEKGSQNGRLGIPDKVPSGLPVGR